MNERNRKIDNESLDILLRNPLLEACPDAMAGQENNIHIIQKEMDMNAAIVFAGQSAVALPAQKEKVLLNDLEQLLGVSNNKRRGWWLWALLIVLAGTSVILFIPREDDSAPGMVVGETNPQISNRTTPVIIPTN